MSLFGVDIAQAVYGGFQGQLKNGTLTRTTEEYDPVEGDNIETETPHSFEGIVEDYNERLIADGVVQANDRKITILAKSLDVVPTTGGNDTHADKIEIEGSTYTTVNVKRDPAGATYTIQGRS